MKTVALPAAIALAIAATLIPGQALADGPVTTGVVVSTPYHGGFYGRWRGAYGGTPAGDYLRGAAAYTRAAGEYNLNTSAAAINLEEARSRNIANHQQYVETYFELRRINSSERAAERRSRPTSDQIARWNDAAMPTRLAASELNQTTGSISWPAVFAADAFTADRQLVDALFAARTAGDSGVGSNSHGTIKSAVASMRATLKGMIRDMPSADYLAAVNFLKSLDYEAGLSVGPVGLAASN